MTTLWLMVAVMTVVICKVQVVEGGSYRLHEENQDLVNKVADSLEVCPSKWFPGNPTPFRYTFGDLSPSGKPDKFRFTTVNFTKPPVYKYAAVRDGPASLEMNGEDYLLSFKIRMEDFNQFNYTFKIESDSSKTVETGLVSIEISDSFAFYEIRIDKYKGKCEFNVEKNVLERIGERKVTVSDIEFFKTHKTLKDQITYWAGIELVRFKIQWLFKRVVFANFEDCINNDDEYRKKVCSLLSPLPEPPGYLKFEYLPKQ